MKKTKEVKFRHWFIVVIAKMLLRPIIKIKYNYKYRLHRELKKQGPFLVLGNHTVAWDPVLLGLSFPYTNYYIASEQIFNLGFLSKLLVYAVNPISKAKASSDVTTIRKSRKIVAEGGSVAVYPEGNVTYDGNVVTINESIVKLVRLLKIPIIIYNTEGLYFSDPRWAVYRKKGKTKGEITRIIPKEEYDKLDNEELYRLIKELVGVNAYQQQEKNLQRYKGKKLAEGLERLVFMDLDKGVPFVTYSVGNKLKSKISDFELTYDEYGYATDQKGVKHTLIDINNAIKESYYHYYINEKNSLLHEEKANIELTAQKIKENKGESHVKMYKDKLELQYDNQVYQLLYDDISISIQGKKKIIINTIKKRYLITFDIKSSPYKYLLTHQIYQKEKNNNDQRSIRELGL